MVDVTGQRIDYWGGCRVKNTLLFISTNRQSAHSAFVSPWNREIDSETFQQSLMHHQLLFASLLLCLFFAHEPTVLSEQVYATPIDKQWDKMYKLNITIIKPCDALWITPLGSKTLTHDTQVIHISLTYSTHIWLTCLSKSTLWRE